MSWEDFLKLQISCFSKFHPLILATYFSIISYFYCGVLTVIFYFLFFFFACFIGKFSLCLFTYISWIHGYLFDSLVIILFFCPYFSSLATRSAFRLSPVSFWNMLFFVFVHYVALQDATGLLYIFLS